MTLADSWEALWDNQLMALNDWSMLINDRMVPVDNYLFLLSVLVTLQPYERMNVADALNPRSFDSETCVIRQGDVADGMYFVEAGTVRITVTGENGVEVEVNQVTKGSYFGELALVTHRPRAASAYCVGPVRLACKLFTYRFDFIFEIVDRLVSLAANWTELRTMYYLIYWIYTNIVWYSYS